jgi:hypothetical protein
MTETTTPPQLPAFGAHRADAVSTTSFWQELLGPIDGDSFAHARELEQEIDRLLTRTHEEIPAGFDARAITLLCERLGWIVPADGRIRLTIPEGVHPPVVVGPPSRPSALSTGAHV